MRALHQSFSVPFEYQVLFTQHLFETTNHTLLQLLEGSDGPAKVFFVIDDGVDEAHPQLQQHIEDYCTHHNSTINLLAPPMVVPGGEASKNEHQHYEEVLKAVDNHGICRHSYLLAIGGGAVLDMVGFAAANAHRGVRHVRIPTTVLAQNDSGVGVKNGINAFGKKNFFGSFAPPYAVINDSHFLTTLDERDWRSGMSEAVKVALIKDPIFFEQLENDATALNQRDAAAMDRLIHRCAELHLAHIGGADPFEKGTSRPLDFGHWSAHKLEQMSNYLIRHGEAVAIGIALDVVYSHLDERISLADAQRVLNLFHTLGFELYTPHLEREALLGGLQEFREHLGGRLTIMLLESIGRGVEVHEVDEEKVKAAIQFLKNGGHATE